MAIRVQIPSPLRSLTGGADEVQVEATDITALIEALEAKHKGFKDRLYDPSGQLRSYVRLFVNEEDVRFLDNEKSALKPGDTVAIVPAIAGGC
jgi:molybdopterin synthase sulfur carrier subunit